MNARAASARRALPRMLLHAAAATPLLWLAFAALDDRLGADPIAELTHQTGQWALRMLLATLAITPLRIIGNWPRMLLYRRALGLWAFAYAVTHLGIYLVLDLGGYWAQIFDDIVKRPFITVGFLAWLMLLPLALTSTRAMMRRLGRHWQTLHRLAYPAAALAVLHFVWLVKADLSEPLLYAAVLAALLLFRVPPLRRLLDRRRAQGRRETE